MAVQKKKKKKKKNKFYKADNMLCTLVCRHRNIYQLQTQTQTETVKHKHKLINQTTYGYKAKLYKQAAKSKG